MTFKAEVDDEGVSEHHVKTCQMFMMVFKKAAKCAVNGHISVFSCRRCVALSLWCGRSSVYPALKLPWFLRPRCLDR
eukprot:6208088-Pleurochrysis_carterae.AAC.2